MNKTTVLYNYRFLPAKKAAVNDYSSLAVDIQLLDTHDLTIMDILFIVVQPGYTLR